MILKKGKLREGKRKRKERERKGQKRSNRKKRRRLTRRRIRNTKNLESRAKDRMRSATVCWVVQGEGRHCEAFLLDGA